MVPSRFAMCFVLQCFGPIQVPRWGPSRPVLVPSCSRAFLTGSGLDGQKQTSWPLPIYPEFIHGTFPALADMPAAEREASKPRNDQVLMSGFAGKDPPEPKKKTPEVP